MRNWNGTGKEEEEGNRAVPGEELSEGLTVPADDDDTGGAEDHAEDGGFCDFLLKEQQREEKDRHALHGPDDDIAEGVAARDRVILRQIVDAFTDRTQPDGKPRQAEGDLLLREEHEGEKENHPKEEPRKEMTSEETHVFASVTQVPIRENMSVVIKTYM